jgi:hypothetical protein
MTGGAVQPATKGTLRATPGAELGAFLFPLVMTALWVVRPVWRRLMLPRARAERFPGAFDFRPMLTIGLGLSLMAMAVLAG